MAIHSLLGVSMGIYSLSLILLSLSLQPIP
jgi:hypothetical protein